MRAKGRRASAWAPPASQQARGAARGASVLVSAGLAGPATRPAAPHGPRAVATLGPRALCWRHRGPSSVRTRGSPWAAGPGRPANPSATRAGAGRPAGKLSSPARSAAGPRAPRRAWASSSRGTPGARAAPLRFRFRFRFRSWRGGRRVAAGEDAERHLSAAPRGAQAWGTRPWRPSTRCPGPGRPEAAAESRESRRPRYTGLRLGSLTLLTLSHLMAPAPTAV